MKKYLSLYYVCTFVTLIFSLFIAFSFSPRLYQIGNNGVGFIINSKLLIAMLIINAILVITFTLLVIKNKTLCSSLMLPIIYIVFFVLVVSLCFLFNRKVLIPYIHFEYYETIILINYFLLNVYSILCIKCKNVR